MVTLNLTVSPLAWLIFGTAIFGFLSLSYRHFTSGPAAPHP